MFELTPVGVKALSEDQARAYLVEGCALDGVSVVLTDGPGREKGLMTRVQVIKHATGAALWVGRLEHELSGREESRTMLAKAAAYWAIEWLVPTWSERCKPANRVYRVALVSGEKRSCVAVVSVHGITSPGVDRCEEFAA